MYFKQFDSFGDAVDFMRKATDAANETLAVEQRAVTWGSYWIRFVPEDQLMVFGHVYTKHELLEGEYKAGSDLPELRETLQAMVANHDRGYMFGPAYSVIEPEGELGDTHRANLWPITRSQFLEAQSVGWVPGRVPGLYTWLSAAYEAYRAHVLSNCP